MVYFGFKKIEPAAGLKNGKWEQILFSGVE